MEYTESTSRQPSLGRARLQGVVLCLIGLGLAIGMATAAWQNAATFLHPGELVDGDRFTGTLAQGRGALALFICLSLTGLAFVANGVQLVRTGRRDRRLMWLAALALVITVAGAWRLLSMLR
jgi:hypothetical protein